MRPSYFQICTGTSGHTEGIQIAYDPDAVAFEQLLSVFWDFIDPTQKDGQGHDWGTQCETIQLDLLYIPYDVARVYTLLARMPPAISS